MTWSTFDLDVVVEDSDANLTALVHALADIDAVFNTAHNPPIRPDVARLRSATGPLLFRTRHGRLDILKEAGGERYETLLSDALVATVATCEVRAVGSTSRLS